MAEDKTLKFLIEIGVIGKADAEAALKLMDEAGKRPPQPEPAEPEHVKKMGFRREARDVWEFVDKAAGASGIPMVTEALKGYRYELTMAAYEAAQKYPEIAAAIGRVALVTTAATVVYEFASKEIEKMNAELDRQGEAAAQAETGWRELNRQVGVEMVKGFAELNRAVDEATDQFGKFSDEAKAALDQQKQFFTDRATLEDGAQKLELQRLEWLKDQKILKEEEYQQRKAQIEERYEERKRQREIDALGAEVALKQQFAQKAAAELGEKEQASNQALKDKLAAEKRPEAEKVRGEKAKEAMEAADKELQAFVAKLKPELADFYGRMRSGMGQDELVDQFRKAHPDIANVDPSRYAPDLYREYSEYDVKHSRFLGAQSEYLRAPARTAAAEEAAEAARRKFDQTKEEESDRRKTGVQMKHEADLAEMRRQQLIGLKPQLDAQGREAARIAGLPHLGDAGQEGGGAAGILARGVAAADAAEHGRKLTAAQQQHVSMLNELLHATGRTDAQATAIIHAIVTRQLTQERELAAIQATLTRQGSQLATGRNRVGG